MARLKIGGKQLGFSEAEQVDHDRLLDAMMHWGAEASWLDHRVARLTLERTALDHWLDRQPSSAWDDPIYQRRHRRSRQVWRLREIAKTTLREIAGKVDDLAKKHPREMSRLTERFATTRLDTPPPATRPTTAPVSAAEWDTAMTRGWEE